MNAAPELKRRRILPRDASAAPLDFVIAVMAFLAALTLGLVLIAERTAQGWQAGLAGRLTVQILPQTGATPDSEMEAATLVLRQTPGIVSATPMSAAYSLSLVQPWLGSDSEVANLPFPRLIDVVLSPGIAIDVAALAQKVKAAAPHAAVEDHSYWIARLRNISGAIVWSAITVLTLIAIATASIVTFATRARLVAHREIVQLLHLMGARDGYISWAFERHYFSAAFFASLCGAVLAAAAFAAAGGLEEAGITAVSFLPPLALRIKELPWLLLVPAGAAIIAWSTARLSVLSALKAFY